MPLLAAEWPDAAPDPREKNFLSIATDVDYNYWALHGLENDYAPILFWKTPIFIMEDLHEDNHADLVNEFERQLPQSVRTFLFGEDDDGDDSCTLKRAITTAQTKRGGSKLTVYIVSSNANQNALLEKICSSIPSRIYLLKGGDFFPESDYTLDECSINTLERLANLRGAGYRFGYPALVFDGSHSTLTYTAADSNGCILGGGIGLGLELRLKCLKEQNPNIDLPEITLDGVKNVIEEARRKKTPMSVFGNNTTDAMIVSMLSEVSNNIRHVSKLWLNRVGSGQWSGMTNAVNGYAKKDTKKKTDEKGQSGNLERKITTTGEAGDIIKDLLESRRGGIFQVPVANNENYNAKNVKQLLHFGVTSIVKSSILDPDNVNLGSAPVFSPEHSLESNLVKGKNQDITKAMTYLGRRAAKKGVIHGSSNKRLLQGIIAKRSEEIPWIGGLSVRYDDGMVEDIEFQDADDMIGLYDDFLKESLKRISMSTLSRAEEPPAPKRTKKRGRPPSKRKPDPSEWVLRRVGKKFDSGIYFGTIMEYVSASMSQDGEFWHVKYDDGDEEDFDESTLKKALVFYKRHKEKDVNGNNKVTNV